MKKTFIAFIVFSALGYCASPIDTAKALLNDTGYIDAFMNMPWQHWQRLSSDQKKVFEDRCQYNRELLETDLADFLVAKFSLKELEQLRSFYRSDIGKKWIGVSGMRGGFDVPELFEAKSRWSDGRQAEARSYVGSLESNQEWKPMGYKGQVGDFTAKPGSGYTGNLSIDVLDGTEADFTSKFGIPSMREQRTPDIVGLDTVWRAYRVGATILKGKIIQISFIRLPDEGSSYAEKMRTKLPTNEVDAFLRDFSRSGKWSSFSAVKYDIDPASAHIEGMDVHCLLSRSTITFHNGSWSGRSVGP